jgi:heme exporter protein D
VSESLLDFLSQGGYARYVWGAYGMALVVLTAEVMTLVRQNRTIRARLGRLLRLRSAGDPR